MKLSVFGKAMAAESAIVSLMEDLGEALNDNPDLRFLGGGNPAPIPEAQSLFNRHLQALVTDMVKRPDLLGVYQSPQGNSQVLQSLAQYFRNDCDWDVGTENITLVSGSQQAFFILFNLFAGLDGDKKRQILLPIVPEYLGYASLGMSEGMFQAHRADIVETGEHRFEYKLNLKTLKFAENLGAVCVSSPTNPSGNVLGSDEIDNLNEQAKAKGVPLIVDLAYGKPFPGVQFDHPIIQWQQNIIAVMSLSKLGLPGVRTSVIVAKKEVIDLVVRTNTIMSLANNNIGASLLSSLLESGDMQKLTGQIIPEYYLSKKNYLVSQIDLKLKGLPYSLHQPKGAFFLWLWLKQLPISSNELYQRLKRRGVLVMAGEGFFFGLDESWAHGRQCLRLSYCQEESVLSEAIDILAQELKSLYQ